MFSIIHPSILILHAPAQNPPPLTRCAARTGRTAGVGRCQSLAVSEPLNTHTNISLPSQNISASDPNISANDPNISASDLNISLSIYNNSHKGYFAYGCCF